MSLRSALGRLPVDRKTESMVREILSFFRRHPDESYSASRISDAAGVSLRSAEEVLEVLVKDFVLDSDGDPPLYTYHPDRFLELEIEGFIRRAEKHTGMLQSNVEKFRQRHGAR